MFQHVLTLLLQLALFGFATASPLYTQTKSDVLGYQVGGGVFGFIVLIIDIIVWSK
jgi:hypothetical protein